MRIRKFLGLIDMLMFLRILIGLQFLYRFLILRIGVIGLFFYGFSGQVVDKVFVCNNVDEECWQICNDCSGYIYIVFFYISGGVYDVIESDGYRLGFCLVERYIEQKVVLDLCELLNDCYNYNWKVEW